jgi:hypothetical protein
MPAHRGELSGDVLLFGLSLGNLLEFTGVVYSCKFIKISLATNYRIIKSLF